MFVTVELFYKWVNGNTERKGKSINLEGVEYVSYSQSYIELKPFSVKVGHVTITNHEFYDNYQTIEKAIANETTERCILRNKQVINYKVWI